MITLKHKDTGALKNCPTGFSWTTFFFGMFVPLIRGDLKWAIILFILAFGIGILTFGIGAVVVGIVFAFKYNNIYIRHLMEKEGYLPADDAARNYCIAEGLISATL